MSLSRVTYVLAPPSSPFSRGKKSDRAPALFQTQVQAHAEAFHELGIKTADRVHSAKHAMPYLAAENNVSDQSIDRVGWSA